MPRIQYHIPMFSVKALLAYAQADGDHYTFTLDRSQTADALLHGQSHLQDDNAIFFQTMCVLHGENFRQPKESCVIEDLADAMLYLDFSEIFDRASKQKRYTERQKKAESLFRPDGITLDLGTGLHRYLAFERSASMSRNARLSFLREDLYAPLRQRMMLDMQIGRCQLSKLYAYNGLMFSSGTRIDGIDLDAPHRVIVVDNETYIARNVSVITAEDDGSDAPVRQYHRVQTQTDVPILCLDGEGLISKSYARTVDKVYCGKKRHSSFQIRMPYIKGMLHEVDFHDFLGNCGVTTLRDIWGVVHPLDAVDIILTKSMFKGFGWLRENEKSWEDYWTAFRTYRHALYITNVNKPKCAAFTELNYQFLNTVSISAEEFRPADLPSGWAHSPEDDPRVWITKATETAYYNFCANDAFRRSYFLDRLRETDERADTRMALLARILKKNPAFLDEPVYTKILDAQAERILEQYAVGRLLVAGDNRFLSGDLMDLLVRLVLDNMGRPNRRQMRFFEAFTTDHITEESFFAPGAAYPAADTCTLLRNPHIARNEEIQLQRHARKDMPRDHYLGHLTGVVMIDPRSTIAERLGGADYDGDMVKTIADPLLNACVRRNYDYDTYARVSESNNLPLLKIPAAEPLVQDANDWRARFEAVRSTFSSRVGQISNAALSRSIIAYDENLDEAQRRQCREDTEMLAILTGLEIDSAKSGVKPELSRYLENSTIPRSRFLKYKALIGDKDARRAWYEPSFRERFEAYFCGTDWDAVTSNLERLPYLAWQLERGTPKIRRKPAPPEALFSFAADTNWTQQLDPKILAAVSDLIATYERCLARIRASTHPAEKYPKKNGIARILRMRNQEEAYDVDVLYTLFASFSPQRLHTLRSALWDARWHLLPDAARQQFLLKHLPEFSLYHDLFSDFRCGGYRLLGDLICDHDDARRQDEARTLSRTGDTPAMAAMVQAYQNRSPATQYREAVAAECRRLLEQLVKPRLAVRYVVALGKRQFLWDVLLDVVEKEVLRA